MASDRGLPQTAEQQAIWQRIEAEADAQCRAQLDARERTSVAYGDYVAWVTTTRGGVTDGLSALHRVGLPKGNAAYTTCEQPVADPALWLSLSPAIIKTMARCGFCEQAFAQQMRGSAA